MKKNFSMIFLLGLVVSGNVNALTTSYGMGEASNDSIIQACTIAENKALTSSLINYNKQQFSAVNQTVCHDTKEAAYCDFIKEIDASTAGTIHSIVDRQKKVRGNTCFVEVQVTIEEASQLPVTVDSKRIYKEGEDLHVKITPSIPLYLHVFNIHENGVDLIFPNDYNKESLIDDRFTFPGPEYSITATTGGSAESKESLLFVFTKRRQTIESGLSHLQFKELLQSIPVNEKRLIQQNIVIRSM